MGKIKSKKGTEGTVYILDEKTLSIKDFVYDGSGPGRVIHSSVIFGLFLAIVSYFLAEYFTFY